MIIEMLGAPGAGKTTMVAAVEEGCRGRGLTPLTVERAARVFAARTSLGRVVGRLAPDRFERPALWAVFRLVSAWHTALFAVRHAGLSRYVLASQRGRPADADGRERRVLYWYLRSMGSYGFLRAMAGPDEVLVIDEGFVHRAVQLHASCADSPTGTQIAAYVALLPRPDLVVHVDASPSVCRQRVHERGVWDRLVHRTPAEVERFLQHAHDTVTLMRAELDRQGWPVLDVDNEHAGSDGAEVALCHSLAMALPGTTGGGAVGGRR